MGQDTPANSLRALVVDDEAAIRRLAIMALTKEGFTCDAAECAQRAMELAASCRYDLIVTDLVMPGANGHSLAVNLLAQADRPLLIILTGILEPRIAKDLLARGVDDIIFKPVEFSTFAAKMRSLVDRRQRHSAPHDTRSVAPATSATASTARQGKLPRISDDEFESRIAHLTRVPPVSKAAIEVFKLTTSPDSDFRQIAAAAQRDPALITDILRLANSSFFNPSGKKVASVDQAVVRLGQNRVGELALATAAFASLTQEKIPFFPLAQVWRECLASGICLEMLVDQAACEPAASSSLFCTAVLVPMGRIMLASVFPERYEQMLKQSAEKHQSLAELEAHVFPQGPGEVISKSLASWGIPDEVHYPLLHTSRPYASIASLNDPLRRRVELIKTAAFLGKLGTGRLDAWDGLELPTQSVLKRLGIHSVDALLAQCRDDLQAIATYTGKDLLSGGSASTAPRLKPPAKHVSSVLAYKRLQGEAIDLWPHILATAGIRLVPTASEAADIDGSMLINAMDAAVHQVVARVRAPTEHELLILANAENASRLQSYGRVISPPLSFGMLQEICSAAASPMESSGNPQSLPSDELLATAAIGS